MNKNLKCKHCGKKYQDRTHQGGSAKIYCSDECRLTHQRAARKEKGYKPPKNILNTCEKCGKEFKSVRKSRYCSVECYRSRNFSISGSGEILLSCSICKESKPLSDEFFYHNKSTTYGFECFCKECASKRNKTPAARKWQAAARQRRADEIKQYEANRRSTQEYKVNRNLSEATRKKTDHAFALKCRMRILMYHSLKKGKGGRKWQDLTGYSVEQLKRHLEKKFTAGMTWERFMAGDIHIDHIIPVSAHNITIPSDPDFKKCWALKNLQPMWAAENISKHDKLYQPFQPSLCIGITNSQSSVGASIPC